MRIIVLIIGICLFFASQAFGQVQKWWEVNGVNGSPKQHIQTMASGYLGRIDIASDTTRVVILNTSGELSKEKQISNLVSGLQTADGFDSLGNASLFLAYSQNSGTGNSIVCEKLSSVDSIEYSVFYSNTNEVFHEPLKLVCDGQEVILLTAVYLPDSTSRLQWLKFDAFSGFLTDSFSTAAMNNTVFSYAEIFGYKAIVHGSTSIGQKNWLLDFSNVSIQEWLWDYENIELLGNEITAFTRNEHIFSLVHTQTDSTKIDALLTLCDTNFTVKWTIRYNSEYNLNDSIVDVAFYRDKIYFAGYVEKDSLNKDYLIASLNHDGTMNWELKYDGPGLASIDQGVSLCVDEVGDVFFTGHSVESGQSRIFSIQLNEYGSVLWESDFNEELQRRAIEVVTRDGNVYLSGQNLSSSLNNFVILYKDSLKIAAVKKLHLEMLATGLSVIQEDSTLKRLVWDIFSRQYSFRRTLSFASIQKFMRSKGIDLIRIMNIKINTEFKLDKESKTVELILSSLKAKEELPFVHFPFLDSLNRSEFVSSSKTNFVYSNDWPSGGGTAFECAVCPNHPYPELEVGLQSSQDVLIVNLEATSFPVPRIRVLNSCLSEKNSECLFCSDIVELLPYENSGPTQHQELELSLNSSSTDCSWRSDIISEFDLFASIKPEWVSSPYSMPGWIDRNQNYNVPATTLRTFGNSKYFLRSITTGKHKSIDFPIYKSKYYCEDPTICYEYGNLLPICKPSTLFKTLGLNEDGIIEEDLEDYSYAEGGFYEIRSEFNDYPSIYFYNPIGKGIFYYQGPDLGIKYNPTHDGGDCLLSEALPLFENNALTLRDLVYFGHSIFGQSPETFQLSMISYNSSSILNTWAQNNLLLGLTNSDMVLSSNLIDVNSIELECPVNGFEFQTVLCTLSCSPDGWFEFYKTDSQTPFTPIPVNTPIKIRIQAQFEDGYIIDKCFVRIFSPQNFDQQTGEPLPLNTITVSPQGRISEYLPNSANYQITIGL